VVCAETNRGQTTWGIESLAQGGFWEKGGADETKGDLKGKGVCRRKIVTLGSGGVEGKNEGVSKGLLSTRALRRSGGRGGPGKNTDKGGK